MQFVKEPANVGREERCSGCSSYCPWRRRAEGATSYLTWRIPALMKPGRLGLVEMQGRLQTWKTKSLLCFPCRRVGGLSVSPDISPWLYSALHLTCAVYMWVWWVKLYWRSNTDKPRFHGCELLLFAHFFTRSWENTWWETLLYKVRQQVVLFKYQFVLPKNVSTNLYSA